ncbi:hypothetical protein SLEP1_g43113 [Rubroshorea leprosula]|uniref:Uncharacterized protein n=1 Tax=Rubroshorea leprosula TaxID=152421 RepID=A0AAV5LC01_9ROSI|nr:hypothetical protein SLEP1_g43113 [Rubroshorea leprosula]
MEVTFCQFLAILKNLLELIIVDGFRWRRARAKNWDFLYVSREAKWKCCGSWKCQRSLVPYVRVVVFKLPK